MSSRVDVDLTMAAGETPPALKVKIQTADKALFGQQAGFRLLARYRERGPRTEIKERTIYRAKITVAEKPLEFSIPLDDVRRYSYPGRRIDVSLLSVVRFGPPSILGEGLEFTKVQSAPLDRHVRPSEESTLGPADVETHARYVGQLLSATNRSFSLLAAFLTALVVGGGALFYIIVNYGIDLLQSFERLGQSQAGVFLQVVAVPVFAILVLALIGGPVFAVMDKQLQGFITLRFKNLPSEIKRGAKLRVGDLVGAKLDSGGPDTALRIVACNMERGRMMVFDKHGRLRRTPFREMVGGVVLFHKKLPATADAAAFDAALNDVMTFDAVFERLFPPNMVTFGRGLAVHWEVQITQGGAVQRRLIGPPAIFSWPEFVMATKKTETKPDPAPATSSKPTSVSILQATAADKANVQ